MITLKTFKLYLQDEKGQQVLVGSFCPSELQREGVYSNTEDIIQCVYEACENLLQLDDDPEFWRNLQPGTTVTRSNSGSPPKRNLMSDFDILTTYLNYSPTEAEEIVRRNRMQKLEDLKLQILAQNPRGLMIPAPEGYNGTKPETA